MSRKRAREEDDTDEQEEVKRQRLLDIIEIRHKAMIESLNRLVAVLSERIPTSMSTRMQIKMAAAAASLSPMEANATRVQSHAHLLDYFRLINTTVIRDFDALEQEIIDIIRPVVKDLINIYRGYVCLLMLANSCPDEKQLQEMLTEFVPIGETVVERFKEFEQSVYGITLQDEFRKLNSSLLERFNEEFAGPTSQAHTPVASEPGSDVASSQDV